MALETKELTNSIIKSVATDAMVYRGFLDRSFNLALSCGYYWVRASAETTDFPKGAYQYGILEVLPVGDFILQRYTTHASGSNLPYPSVYVRMRYQTTFSRWSKMVGEDVV